MKNNVGLFITKRAQLNPNTEAMVDLETSSLEAEALWGEEAVGCTKNLRKCVIGLSLAIDGFVRHAEPRNEVDERIRREAEKKVWWVSDDPETDPFSGAITRSVKEVEDFARPRLRGGKNA